MLAQLTSSEFAEWQEAYALDPWGSEVEDHRAGMIAATIGNAFMKRNDGRAFQPTDYFPSRTDLADEESGDVSEQVHAIFGRMVKKEPRDG